MARINKLICYLQGTSISLKEACNSLGFDRKDLTAEELEELDSQLFQCDNCGWWYNIDKRAYIEHNRFQDNNICTDCAPEFYFNGYEEY